jgi:hypothetical protein
MPTLKEFAVWREFYDMVTDLRCEGTVEVNAKKRRSSIYKLLHKKSSLRGS